MKHLALLLILVLVTACSRKPSPSLPAPPPVARVAESEPPCPGVTLDAELDKPRTPHAPAAPVSLSSLLMPRARRILPRRAPRVDLGRIVHIEAQEPRHRELYDLSRLDLPRDIVAGYLPGALLGRWNRLFAEREEIQKSRLLRLSASRDLAECKTASCSMEHCLGKLEAELATRIRRSEDSFRVLEEGFIEDLQDFISAAPESAPPGATLALSYAAEDRVRRSSDVPSDLEAPIALYERVKQTAPPGSEIDWWARYLLGYALADMGEVGRARREFAALAVVPASPRLLAEASFRKGDFEVDPSQAAVSFEVAAKLSVGDPGARTVHFGAAYRLAEAELSRHRFQASLAAAKELAWDVERTATKQGELDSFFALLTPLLSEAMGALSVEEVDEGATVPETIFGKLGAEVADRAIERFDVEAAVRAWQAVLTHAPRALEASRALTGLIAAHERADRQDAAYALRKQRARDYGPRSAWAAELRAARANARRDDPRFVGDALETPPPLPRIPVSHLDRERDLEARVQALLFACDRARILSDPGEVELRAEAARDGRARVTMQAPKGTDGTALSACLVELGPAYFVDAPADMRVTVRFSDEGAR